MLQTLTVGIKRLAVESLNNSDARVNDRPEGIRYPGPGRMLLVWTVIGALTVARSRTGFAPSGFGRESLAVVLACTGWYFPWAILTPLLFRIERRFPLGAAGWPRHVGLLAAISVPFCLLASPAMVAGGRRHPIRIGCARLALSRVAILVGSHCFRGRSILVQRGGRLLLPDALQTP